MKIRIKGDTIRLRLSLEEVNQIGKFESVIESTSFGSNQLKYALATHKVGELIHSKFEDGLIEISIRSDVAKSWAKSEQVGIQSDKKHIPSVLIEKDFQCLTVRENEDESNLFPNPNINC